MVRFFFRGTLGLWAMIFSVLFIVLTVIVRLIDDVGVIAFTTFDSDGANYIYIDYNINKLVWSEERLGETQPAALQLVLDKTRGGSRLLVADGTTEAEFAHFDDVRPIDDGLVWATYGESAILIHTRSDPAETILYEVDLLDGERRIFMIIDGLFIETYFPAPDGTSLLLREEQGRLSRPINPLKRIYWVDLKTGDTVPLGSPAFAYFSPDSTKVVFGTETERLNHMQVDVLDIPSRTITIYGVTASHEDTPFFPNAIPGVAARGVMWSNKSDQLAVINRYINALNIISLDGEEQWMIEGGRLIPYAWSPDDRYLLTSGYDADLNIGVFIIDTEQQTIQQMQSQATLQTSLTELVWSPDSRHIAVLRRTSGLTQKHYITVFNADGTIRNEPRFVNSDTYLIGPSLRWFPNES